MLAAYLHILLHLYRLKHRDSFERSDSLTRQDDEHCHTGKKNKKNNFVGIINQKD